MKEWISELAPYTPGLTVEGAIKLASNENGYGPSPKVVSGLREKVGEVFRYPYKDAQVKEALARYCGAKPENIVLGNGSDELIDMIMKSFKGPVASHYPTFVEYPTYARVYNERYISSRLNQDLSFNARSFMEETKEANILFLCTPNNPTGTVIDLCDIKAVAQTGKLVVVDEAYFEFHGGTAAGLIRELPNLVVLRTMAKAFGLAGLRFGYAIASPEVAVALNKVKAPFNVNYLAHEAAMLALRDLAYMKRTVRRILSDRRALERKLAEEFRVIPSRANFLLVDVSPLEPQEFFDVMLKHGIVVRPQPRFEGFEGNFVRITVGTTQENRRLVAALDKVWRSLKK